MKLTVREKVFLFLVLVLLSISIPEFFYMNGHSSASRAKQQVVSLLNAGYTLTQIQKYQAQEPRDHDGIYSPELQIYVIVLSLGVLSIWVIYKMCNFDKKEDKKPEEFISVGIIYMLVMIISEVIIFLCRLLT